MISSTVFQNNKNHGHKKKKQKQRSRKKYEETQENPSSRVGGNLINRIELDDSTISDTIVTVESKLTASMPRNGVNLNLAGVDLDTVWQDYWGKYGEYLVWEGWVAKYPDQIDFEKLQAVPAIAEVEVQSEAVPDNQAMEEIRINDMFTKDAAEKEKIDAPSDAETGRNYEYENEDNISKNEHTVSEIANSNTSSTHSSDVCKKYNTSAEAALEMSDQDYISPCSPMQYLSPNFKCVNGEDIIATLQKKTELAASNVENVENCDVESDADNLANERTEMVNMMHSYSNHHSQSRDLESLETENENINAFSKDQVEENENKNLTEEDFSKAWEELWNEHYMESYWYYYNQFVEKFNKIAPGPEVVNDFSVAEGIAVVNEQGELEVVQELTDFRDKENAGSSTSFKETSVTSEHNFCAENEISRNECSSDNTFYVVDNGTGSTDDVVYVIKNEDGSSVSNLDMESIAAILNDVQIDGKAFKTENHIDEAENENSSKNFSNYDVHELDGNEVKVCRHGVDVAPDDTEEMQTDNISECKINSDNTPDEPTDGSRRKRKHREKQNQQQAAGSSLETGGLSQNLSSGSYPFTSREIFYVTTLPVSVLNT